MDCRLDRETQLSRVHTTHVPVCSFRDTQHGAAYRRRRRRSDRNKVFHFFSVHCIPGTWHNIFNTNRWRVRMTILFSLLFSFNNDLYHDATPARESHDPAHVSDTVVIIPPVLTWIRAPAKRYTIINGHISHTSSPKTCNIENYENKSLGCL